MNGSTLFVRAKSQFVELLELSPEAREARLARLREREPALALEVESLLGQHEAGTDRDFEQPLLGAGFSLQRVAAECLSDASQVRFDDFLLDGVLGVGATSVVYAARVRAGSEWDARVPAGTRLALKVLRPGALGALPSERFLAEARVLGSLDHPGIPQTFGAGFAHGAAGPQAFLAVEQVEGHELLDHLREHAPSPTARLGLLIEVGEALQHAHAHGILHRDVKPENVLVGRDGRARLIDFGLAHAAHHATDDVQTRAGTLPYMAPELLDGRGAPSIASEVYALGVLLYRVLAGRLPIDVSGLNLTEAARRLQRLPAEPLGRFDPALRGPLEAVVHRALARDPAARFPSVADLVDELRRLVDGRPVRTPPIGRIRRARDFVRRHRSAVAVLGGLFAVLVLGIVSTGLALLEVQQARTLEAAERRRAETAAADAAAITAHLLELLRGVRDEEGREAAFDRAAAALDAELDARPEVRVELAAAYAVVLNALGNLPGAVRMLELEIAEREALGGGGEAGDPADRRALLRARIQLGLLRSQLDPQLDPRPALRDEVRRLAALGGDPILLGGARVMLAEAELAAGAFADSLQVARAAAETFEAEHQRSGILDIGWLAARQHEARCLEQLGARDDAAARFRDCLAIAEAAGLADHPRAVTIRMNLGILLGELGDHAGALRQVEAAHAARLARHGAGHVEVLQSMHNLGSMLILPAVTDPAELRRGRELVQAALDGRSRLFGPHHPTTAISRLAAARAAARLGDDEVAASQFATALQDAVAGLGAEHPHTAAFLQAYGEFYATRGDLESAHDLLVRADRVLAASYGVEHPRTREVARLLMRIRARLGGDDAAGR